MFTTYSSQGFPLSTGAKKYELLIIEYFVIGGTDYFVIQF